MTAPAILPMMMARPPSDPASVTATPSSTTTVPMPIIASFEKFSSRMRSASRGLATEAMSGTSASRRIGVTACGSSNSRAINGAAAIRAKQTMAPRRKLIVQASS